jgi:alpha-beta hydrolase superfamily lysophospholipase
MQRAMHPPAAFQGPRFDGDRFISFDGARLGLTTWEATAPAPAHEDDQRGAPAGEADHAHPGPVEPWAVIIGVHGMDDYAETFYLAAPYWAAHGVTTYAYDARGFGRSPHRGVWPGETLMVEDLRTAVAVARRRHPKALIAVVGESMGAAEAMVAFSGPEPPDADRLILCAPAVWGWSALPMLYSIALWTGAHTLPHQKVTPPPGVHPTPSDNVEMLRKLGRDRLMLFETRIDAVYGLVRLMDDAAKGAGRISAPTAFLYGQKDEIVPRDAAFSAVARLNPGARTAYYPQSYHMMLRDLHAQIVWDDILAFIADPKAPLPSGAPPVPGARKTMKKR